MSRLIFFFLFSSYFLVATEYQLKSWERGLSFGEYLNRNNIDATKFYSSIHKSDITYLNSIMKGTPYFESKENGELKVLIPIGDEMQLYIHKKGDKYGLDVVPIKYKKQRETIAVTIKNNCYIDFKNKSRNGKIANSLKKVFRKYVDFTKLKKGDKVVATYIQKSIDGFPWGEPEVIAGYIKRGNREYFAIKRGKSYKIYSNKEIKKVKFVRCRVKRRRKYQKFSNPLNYMRVTSRFTYKRWHPVLHRYRPHLGVDLGARRGTPIHAVGSGRVIYSGWMRGYGKVIKISHGSGLVSLYAHQSRLHVKRGQRVKKGQVIGRVGSTGVSTGPHLHLGMYKNGRPVNPFRYINKKAGYRIYTLSRKKKVVKNVKNLEKYLPPKEKRVYNSLKNFSLKKHTPHVWKDYNEKIKITIKAKDVRDDRLSKGKGDSKFDFK